MTGQEYPGRLFGEGASAFLQLLIQLIELGQYLLGVGIEGIVVQPDKVSAAYRRRLVLS